MLNYITDLDILHKSIAGRDWAKSREIIDRFSKTSSDFPTAGFKRKIEGPIRESDACIERATKLREAGEIAKANQQVLKAAEHWPTNPKLDQFRSR